MEMRSHIDERLGLVLREKVAVMATFFAYMESPGPPGAARVRVKETGKPSD